MRERKRRWGRRSQALELVFVHLHWERELRASGVIPSEEIGFPKGDVGG